MVTTAMPRSHFHLFQLSTSPTGLPVSCLAPASAPRPNDPGLRRCGPVMHASKGDGE